MGVKTMLLKFNTALSEGEIIRKMNDFSVGGASYEYKELKKRMPIKPRHDIKLDRPFEVQSFSFDHCSWGFPGIIFELYNDTLEQCTEL